MILDSLDFNIPIKSLEGEALVQLFDDDEAQTTGSAFKDVFKVFCRTISCSSIKSLIAAYQFHYVGYVPSITIRLQT